MKEVLKQYTICAAVVDVRLCEHDEKMRFHMERNFPQFRCIFTKKIE
jgi:hypothetical protein